MLKHQYPNTAHKKKITFSFSNVTSTLKEERFFKVSPPRIREFFTCVITGLSMQISVWGETCPQRWKKYFPFCELVFQLLKFSVKLHDFQPYLTCKIAQMIVISEKTKANSASYDPSWL